MEQAAAVLLGAGVLLATAVLLGAAVLLAAIEALLLVAVASGGFDGAQAVVKYSKTADKKALNS